MAQVGSRPVDRRTPPAPPAPPNGDWAAQVADSIERAVGNVRDKTTGPALTVARAVVYGIFAALVGIVVLVLAIIGLVRLLNNYLPDSVFGESHMWAAYLIMGLACVIPGTILWIRRRSGGVPTGEEVAA
jgi:hypothetical protein